MNEGVAEFNYRTHIINLLDDIGRPKYGIDVESAVFSMRRYCWCGKPDCPQCWDESQMGPPPKEMMDKYGMAEDEDGKITAPNFWHKKSGLKVWWYKYIGKSMKISHVVSIQEIEEIRQDCLAVINPQHDAVKTSLGKNKTTMMIDEIKVGFKLQKKPVENPENICEGCALRVGRFACQNRELCPYEEGVEECNWKQTTRLVKLQS